MALTSEGEGKEKTKELKSFGRDDVVCDISHSQHNKRRRERRVKRKGGEISGLGII
jgi:hypothetical protein